VLAAADGLVIRSENGMVVQDLNKDGYEQTGWTLLYQHIAAQERVPYGTLLQAGDRIGHPSCEGGPSNGTHLHFARRYNGEWIPADQDIPFNLDGWISQGNGKEYDGKLIRNGVIVEAYGYITPESQISR
jgi:LasA protease